MTDSPSDGAGPRARPVLRIVRGEPSPAELAALVAVLAGAAQQGGSDQEPAEQPRTWSAYWRQQRTPMRPAPRAWRESAGPR